jgi:hypothetical protein
MKIQDSGSKTAVVGWREWVHLPKFSSVKIKAKIDTGAKTSALHAEDIKIIKKGGRRIVRFKILPTQRSSQKSRVVEAELVEKRKIRSSVGTETIRPVVRTLLKVGGTLYEIELTLVNRDIMGFRMLIGREALKKRFIVDPSKSFLVSKVLNKRLPD